MNEYGSRFGRPRPEPDDLETILARALRTEAERVRPVGDGLSRIRSRTESRRSVLAWFSSAGRPVLAGGTLVLTLIAGAMLAEQLTGDQKSRTLAERNPAAVQPRSFTPDPKVRIDPTPEPYVAGGYGGEEPRVDTRTTPVPAAASTPVVELPAEVVRNRSDLGIPQDDGGNYVAILAPLSGRTYDSPLTLYGKARVFEGAITIDISQNGKVVQRAHTSAAAAGAELAEWDATIALEPGNYRIDAYALSPENDETRLAADSIWITVM